jgi:hypothetical protein
MSVYNLPDKCKRHYPAIINGTIAIGVCRT